MPAQKNEGEGNHTAARGYKDAQDHPANSGKVAPVAEDVARTLDPSQAPRLRESPRIGKAHAKAEDAALKR